MLATTHELAPRESKQGKKIRTPPLFGEDEQINFVLVFCFFGSLLSFLQWLSYFHLRRSHRMVGIDVEYWDFREQAFEGICGSRKERGRVIIV